MENWLYKFSIQNNMNLILKETEIFHNVNEINKVKRAKGSKSPHSL